MDFSLGNAWKYLWRAGKKSNTIVGTKNHPTPAPEIVTRVKAEEDIAKAVWYISREIDSRKGRILRRQVVDAVVPSTMVDKFNQFIKYEISTRAQVFLCLFNGFQAAGSTAPLYDALKHIEALKNEVRE